MLTNRYSWAGYKFPLPSINITLPAPYKAAIVREIKASDRLHDSPLIGWLKLYRFDGQTRRQCGIPCESGRRHKCRRHIFGTELVNR